MMRLTRLSPVSREIRSIGSTKTAQLIQIWRRYVSDNEKRNQNAARLRALRKAQPSPSDSGTSSTITPQDGVNYRYRQGNKESLSSLWGDDETINGNQKEISPKTQKENKGYVPFFEEVDAFMKTQSQQTTEPKSSLETIFHSLDQSTLLSDDDNNKKGDASSVLDAAHASSLLQQSSSSLSSSSSPTDLFMEESYQEYRFLMNEIFESEKFLRKHTKRPLTEEYLRPVREWLEMEGKLLESNHLPTLGRAVREGPQEGMRSDLLEELATQRMLFMEKTKMDQKQYKTAAVALMAIGRNCASRQKSLPLEVAWEKVKESGMLLGQEALNNFLHACTTYSSSSRRRKNLSTPMASILDILDPSSTQTTDPEKTDNTEEEPDVAAEIATFHDVLHKPTDQSVSVRVKALVAQGDARSAEDLITKSGNDDLRLRTYLPIFRLYTDQGNIAAALSVFKRMRDTPSVILEPESYVHLIAAIAERGYFRVDAPEIKGAVALGFEHASGPLFFDEIASGMAEDVLDISSASARRLHGAFETAYKDTPMGKNLHKLHPLAPLKPLNEAAEQGEMVASRVLVDTGTCPRTGARLRLIKLEREQRKQLHDSLRELSKTQFEKFAKQRHFGHDPAAELDKFASWLDTRKGKPFTAIIDGANVAYYMQNFDKGKFNYHQIKFMVDTLDSMKENPLVILPAKYSREEFSIVRGSGFAKQILDEKELEIAASLRASGRLYTVPPLCLDDYYWMLASVSDQVVSRNDEDLDVAPGNEDGRWPGTRPMLITNDQMRDHKLEVLEPRLFRRWYASHIVNYTFSGFVDDECVDEEIGFSPVDFFSKEIQDNPSPDDNDAGYVWHFPVGDWDESERFCVKIPHAETVSAPSTTVTD